MKTLNKCCHKGINSYGNWFIFLFIMIYSEYLQVSRYFLFPGSTKTTFRIPFVTIYFFNVGE